eukprot:jgi/Bigna1/78313/fgenesh1_pg.54_\
MALLSGWTKFVPHILFVIAVVLSTLLLLVKNGAFFTDWETSTTATSKQSMLPGKLPNLPDQDRKRKGGTLDQLHRHLTPVKEAAKEETVITVNMDLLSEPMVWSSQRPGPYHSYSLLPSLDSGNFSWFFSDFNVAAPPFRYCAIRQRSSVAWDKLYKHIQAGGVLEAVCGSGGHCAAFYGGSSSSSSSSSSSPIPSRAGEEEGGAVQERIWLHSAGATAQLHIDYQHNLKRIMMMKMIMIEDDGDGGENEKVEMNANIMFAQVVGRKRFVIVAPSLMPFCCLYPYNHPAKRQSAMNAADRLNLTHSFIFRSQMQKKSSIENPSPHPRCPPLDIAELRQQLAQSGEGGLIWEVILQPGDVLALPAGFGHYVESLDGTLSFNVWIDDQSREVVAQAFSLLSQATIAALKAVPRSAVELTLASVRMWLTIIWGGGASTLTSSSASPSSSSSSSPYITSIISQGYRQRYHPHLLAEESIRANGDQNEQKGADDGGFHEMPRAMGCSGVLNEDFKSKIGGFVSKSARLMTQGFPSHSARHLETLNILDRMLLMVCKLRRLKCDNVATLASLYLSFLPCEND